MEDDVRAIRVWRCSLRALVLGCVLLSLLASGCATTKGGGGAGPESSLAVVSTSEHQTQQPRSAAAADPEEKLLDEEQPEEIQSIPDPLEPWNRLMFTFNDRFYFYVFKPVAQGYNAVVPEGGRIAIRNFFSNLMMPVRFTSALLQGKPRIAVYEFSRFLINSSVGLGGFIDVASQEPELRSYNEDMGQTLGTYGIGHGFYIVWPFLGPSSLRDTFGMIGDGFLNPVNYLVPFPEVFAAHAYKYTNDGSLKIGEYEDFKKSAIEPYVALRDAYVQRRKKEVEQ